MKTEKRAMFGPAQNNVFLVILAGHTKQSVRAEHILLIKKCRVRKRGLHSDIQNGLD